MLQPVKDVRALCNIMKFLDASENSLSRAEYQLNNINWVNKDDTEAFWSEVGCYKDASGCNPFADLFQCAVSALILPHSNAAVERIFSAINNVKSKTRNNMKLQLLNAILTIKFGLIRRGKCCSTYQLQPEVIRDIGTVAAYQTHASQSEPSTSTFAAAADDED